MGNSASRNLNSTQETQKKYGLFQHALFVELIYDPEEAIRVVAEDCSGYICCDRYLGTFWNACGPIPRQDRETAPYLFDAIRTAIAGAMSDTPLRLASLKENDRAAEQFLTKLEEAEAMKDERGAASKAGAAVLCAGSPQSTPDAPPSEQ